MTIRLWLARAALRVHAEKVHGHFFQILTLGHLLLDELFTTLRNKAHDLWVCTACDPVTKLIPALQVGPRTQAMPYIVVHAPMLALAPGCLAIFTSDGLKPVVTETVSMDDAVMAYIEGRIVNRTDQSH